MGGGTGAVCGGIKGGFGYAETELESGVSVAAAVIVNAAGSPVNSATGRLWADRMQHLATPSDGEREALVTAYTRGQRSVATTIGVILTDATLSKSQATKIAAVAHDGMARAIRPMHSMFDGDTVFCLASSGGRLPKSRFAPCSPSTNCSLRPLTCSPTLASTAFCRLPDGGPGRATPTLRPPQSAEILLHRLAGIPTLVAQFSA